MTDFALRASENSMKEYVKLTIAGKTLGQAIPLILCAALITAIPLMGLIGYIMTKNTAMLILFISSLVIDVGILVFMHLMIKSYAARLCQAYSAQSGMVCAVSENDIIIVRDNAPQRMISWDRISEITEGKYAYFLKAEDETLIVLEKEAVLSGTLQEASQIIESKQKAAKK